MSANDNKRFYWLKLKKDFFQQHQMKVLKALPNGRLYALIYLELLAESTSHDGELRYSKMLPYDTVTLAAVIDEDKDNLEKAIETFVNLELVELLDDGTIFMREINRLIGSETGQTIRKREARITQEGKSGVNLTLENRDKRLEIRDKNIYTRFAKPTIEEIAQYCFERHNGINANYFYDFYESKGWKVGKNPMKDWKACIRTWERNTKSRSDEDTLPTYDTSHNIHVSKEEEEELLKMIGRSV